jgi:hypothetical protein
VDVSAFISQQLASNFSGRSAVGRPRPSRRVHRPLQELCVQLRIDAVVRSGILDDKLERFGYAKLVGPEQRGLRARSIFSPDCVAVEARLSGEVGQQSGSIVLRGDFPGAVWIDERPPRGGTRWWSLRCVGCGRSCNRVFWPPAPDAQEWRCRRCHKVRYPDKRRLHTLPPCPDLNDELAVIERDLARVKQIRKRRCYDTVKRGPRFAAGF